MALSELPVELRALLWEEMTLQDLIKTIRALPSYGPEIVENVRVITGDGEGLKILPPILEQFPYLRIMKPKLWDPFLLTPHPFLQEVTIDATTEDETNHVLNNLFDGIRKITIVNWNTSRVIITGRKVECQFNVCGVTGSLSALALHQDKIDHLVVREEALGGPFGDYDLPVLFNFIIDFNIRIIEYELPTRSVIDNVYRFNADYDFGYHLKAVSGQVGSPNHGTQPERIEELVIPLCREGVIGAIEACPGLKRVGFMILGDNGYANDDLAFLIERYSELHFVVFMSCLDPDGEDWRNNGNTDPSPWIKSHPRITLARQK